MTAALHSVHSLAGLKACLGRRGGGEAILLLEDGVYAALADGAAALTDGRKLHVLEEDLAARGLADRALAPDIRRIDMAGFVALCVAHSPIIAWM